MVELYWMALLRDVNFNDYETKSSRKKPPAISPGFRISGPKDRWSGNSADSLSRQVSPAATDGPYISQFLLQPAGFGAQEVDQRINTNAADEDFGTSFSEWLDIQNGLQPIQTLTPGGKSFMRKRT